MMLIIYGPTVTGKTSLSIDLAKKFNGEIISADSRQVYKNLDVGTGKVSFDSKLEKFDRYWIVDGVKIHGFDLADPGDTFTVADFTKFAKSKVNKIEKEGKLAIIAGGTGYYIYTLINGLASYGIPADPKLRLKLEKLTAEELFQKLLAINPIRAKSMNQSDKQNPRRLIRAIEIASTGKKLDIGNLRFEIGNSLVVGLTAPNDYLYQKSDNWLQIRLDHNLIDEVDGLIKKGISLKWLDNLGLEYRWISRFLTGKITKAYAIERLKGDIHDLIRRQKTWFNKFKDIKLFDVSKPQYQKKLEKTVDAWYDKA